MHNAKKKNPLIIVVTVLLVLALILCGAVAILWFGGQKSLETSGEGPNLPAEEVQEQEPEATEDLTGEEEVDDGSVEYNGVRYRYNESMRSILLMGVDNYDSIERGKDKDHMADVFVLAALNFDENKMSLIALPRDIMCDIELKDANGEPTQVIHTQLAFSYAYGERDHKSCELSRETVSNIFFGLPIHGYAAYVLHGIEELNDAVGGVTVRIIADVPFHVMEGCENMIEGATVTLTGKQAFHYVQHRVTDRLDANDLRMSRQKQYMLSLVSAAKEKVLKDPASILTLYDAVDEYVLTDLGINEITYLATKAVNMEFDQNIHKVSGELKYNEENHYAELHVDRTALTELMLDVFYVPVT